MCPLTDHSGVVRPRMARLLGKSLVWVEGEAEHKRMKAMFIPSLSPSSIRHGLHNIQVAASNVRHTFFAAFHVTDMLVSCS